MLSFIPSKIVKLFLCKAILPSLDFARHDILGLKMSAKYGTFLFVTRLSNHGTNIYGFFGLVLGLQLESMLFFYFSLSFCSAMVSSTICCNWYVATPNGLLIPLRDHSTMVLLWERHISSPMLGLSSSPLRSSSAALT